MSLDATTTNEGNGKVLVRRMGVITPRMLEEGIGRCKLADSCAGYDSWLFICTKGYANERAERNGGEYKCYRRKS
jgi:hypothetical protein